MNLSFIKNFISKNTDTELFPKNKNEGKKLLNEDTSFDVPTNFKYISLGAILILLIFFFGAYLWKMREN